MELLGDIPERAASQQHLWRRPGAFWWRTWLSAGTERIEGSGIPRSGRKGHLRPPRPGRGSAQWDITPAEANHTRLPRS